MPAIDRIIEGAVDIHVDFSSDPRVERRCDAIEIAQDARNVGMRGVVFKSHEYPTLPVAYTVGKIVPGISLIGGIILNVEVGGLNPMAVEASANMGGRVVWMPTFSARTDRQRQGLDGGIYPSRPARAPPARGIYNPRDYKTARHGPSDGPHFHRGEHGSGR